MNYIKCLVILCVLQGCGFAGFDYCDFRTYDGRWNMCVETGDINSPSPDLVTSWVVQTERLLKEEGYYNSNTHPVKVFFLDRPIVSGIVTGRQETIYGYAECWSDHYLMFISNRESVGHLFFHEFSHVIIHNVGIKGSENDIIVHTKERNI